MRPFPSNLALEPKPIRFAFIALRLSLWVSDCQELPAAWLSFGSLGQIERMSKFPFRLEKALRAARMHTSEINYINITFRSAFLFAGKVMKF